MKRNIDRTTIKGDKLMIRVVFIKIIYNHVLSTTKANLCHLTVCELVPVEQKTIVHLQVKQRMNQKKQARLTHLRQFDD